MKIANNMFKCDWDGTEFFQNVKKTEGNGKKGRGSDHAVCPKCFMLISQRDKDGKK